MRFQITLIADRPLNLPISYNEYLTAIIYGLLGKSDPEYATFLHDEGYKVGDTAKRIKPFTYSQLMTPSHCRRIDRETRRIVFSPGPIAWQISSPLGDFIRNVAGGMLAEGAINLGPNSLSIESINVMPCPEFTETMRFTCLTPIVAAKPRPKSEGGGSAYLRPAASPEEFSEVIRGNLLSKYAAVYQQELQDTRFAMSFDENYLARDKDRGCKLTQFKGTDILGALAPFTATGNPELIRLGYEAGLGTQTGLGHGMVAMI
jgi:CRISPR-associated endoribonuclease Cas6